MSDCAHVWIYRPGTDTEWRCLRCPSKEGPLAGGVDE